MPSERACFERRQRVGGLAALRDRDDERARVRHAVAVAVLARHLDRGRDLGHRLEPVLGDRAAVVARAAGEDEDRVDLLEDAVGAVAEQLGRDAGHRVERVGDRLRLLEDLLLHVVPVGAELGRAGVGDDGSHRPLDAAEVALGVGVADPVLAELQVDDVAFLEVDDLVGDAGERHRVGGEEVLARARHRADAEDERRAVARADHAVRLVAADHGDRIGAAQARQRALHRLEQVAVVEVVDEVGDDLGVGLRHEPVALRLQLGAQLVVVLDDAVVDEADAAGRGQARRLAAVGARVGRARRRCWPRPVREVRVGVVDDGRAVRRPARVGDAGAALEIVGRDVRRQLGDPRRAARPAQAAALVDGDAARVVAAVFEAAQPSTSTETMLRALTAPTIPHMMSPGSSGQDCASRGSKLNCKVRSELDFHCQFLMCGTISP